ncbi:MAG: ABC transporter ATP-binding protein/permease [Burkholderiales bacterium]|nr:ABC transporter ATP-binding protein/permease [Burkholderiales bacterium]
MQWTSQQWLESLVWIARTYLFVLVGFALVAAGLGRFTRWGRQFVRLAGSYFDPRRDWRPLAAAALVLLLAIAGVRLNVLLSYWNNGFYDSVQALDAKAFWFFMGLFGLLATLHVLRVLVAFYVAQAFEIRWRTWMNDRLTDDWLAGSAYYRARFVPNPTDNPDQRIQVDVGSFVSSTRSLAIGAVDAVVSLVTFTLILWNLSGPIAFGGIEVPRAMVFLVYVYVIVASVFAFWLGRPLIRLNFLAEKLGADFRYALIRLREYAENVAFYRGEAVERATLRRRFDEVIRNLWAIVFRSMKFDGFNLAVSQAAVVFPFLLQAQRFFSGQIKLGDVMQTSQAFGQVQDALSFFRLSYDAFAQYRAVLDRLTGFLDVDEQARALPGVRIDTDHDTLEIDALDVRRPDGAVLVRGLGLKLAPGDALLVQGASGAGKTTLLRALAGLWPFAGGRVRAPLGRDALFLPQRPYLPLGTLRAALAYPDAEVGDTQAQAALERAQLAHLSGHLDAEADWSQQLSIGEQQRLAFARVLLKQPRLVFLDEASSAMDEGLEHAMYTLLRRELPDCIVVSVGHRRTLHAFHTHRLQLEGEARWLLGPAAAAT